MPCKKKKKKNLLSSLKAGFKNTRKFIEKNINPDVYSGNYMVPDYTIGFVGFDGIDIDAGLYDIDIPIKTKIKNKK